MQASPLLALTTSAWCCHCYPCCCLTGPAVAWHPGRRDALSPGPLTVPFSARLPDGNFAAAGVLYNFLNYGLTVREAVALIGGGHSFGGADPTTTGEPVSGCSLGQGAVDA